VPPGRDPENSPTDRGVVDFDDARVKIRSRVRPTTESLMSELGAIRSLLDQGLSTEAKARLALLISSARSHPGVLALARCALSITLEQQGHYRDSLAAVSMYETPESRTKLDNQTTSYLRVQIGLGYNYNGDHPKAIAMLKSTLRDYAESGDSNLGHIYAALSRVYRTISEYPIARDYAQRALESFRQNGDWRGLAESYFGVGVADIHEGNYESGLDNLEQALKLIGDRPAAYMLGRTYANMAGACWFLKRPQEGIDYLKQAITYYERTDHKTNAADGYNNLGINLVLIGQWDRAHEALERA
jgi:tetratricopeptide (TPR) repeat protein